MTSTAPTTASTTARRLTRVGLAATAVVAAATSVGAPSAHAATPSARTTAAAATNRTAVTAYLVTTTRGTLQLVDRGTGRVLRTVATAPRGWSYTDATIAPDGSVWAVRRGAGFFDSMLVHVVGARATEVARYATSVRVSPNGSQVAYTRVTPAPRGSRSASSAVVVADARGTHPRVLASAALPVDAAGRPAVQPVTAQVSTWVGNATLALSGGCCDSGAVALVPTRPYRARPLGGGMPDTRTITGDGATRPVAVRADGSLVVPVAVERGRGTVADPVRVVALDLYAVTTARPLGVKIGRVNAPYGDEGALRTWVRRTGARAVDGSVAALPYQGSGLVSSFVAR